MLRSVNGKRGIVLLIVLGVILVVAVMASAVLTVISNHGRLTRHQVYRIKSYYAARGIMNYALERLRLGEWVPAAATVKYACFQTRGCIDAVTKDYDIPEDADIPCKVQVKIYPLNFASNSLLNNKVTQIDIKTDYTYQ